MQVTGIHLRRIPGFERYLVGDDGKVYSGYFKNGTVEYDRTSLKILKQRIVRQGYLIVNLRKDGRQYTCYVHRLVLIAFIGEPTPNQLCAHLNNCGTDNRLCNLAWVTQKENMGHKLIHGTHLEGENIPNSKLTNKEVTEIKKLILEGVNQSLIARTYNINQSTVSRICSGKMWKHLKGGDSN